MLAALLAEALLVSVSFVYFITFVKSDLILLVFLKILM